MLSEDHGVLVFLEQENGRILNISLKLLRAAVRIADVAGSSVSGVITGYGAESAAESLRDEGIGQLFIGGTAHGQYLPDVSVNTVKAAVETAGTSLLLFTSSIFGIEVASRIAVRFRTGIVNGCTHFSVNSDNGRILLSRPADDGGYMNSCIFEGTYLQIATARPEITISEDIRSGVRHPRQNGKRLALRYLEDYNLDSAEIILSSIIYNEKKHQDITRAHILVAGGRGVGGKENFKVLRAIADLLGGEVACTRACVEAGWMEPACQVGQTGKTVKPDLYIACGISGAFQHIAGMREAKKIIAINKNPLAPIFNVADLGIVGDLDVIMPKLLEVLRKQGGAKHGKNDESVGI